MRYQDVFVPGGFPEHTYNPRVRLNLERRLAECNQNLCKLVTVTGQTKSGKTVLAKRVLPRSNAVWVDGGTVSAEEDFWQGIIVELDLFQSKEEQSSNAVSGTLHVTGKAEASIIVARGSGEAGAEIGSVRGSGVKRTQSLSSALAARNGLRKLGAPLVVDDFHYIPREVQGRVVRALKPLIFDGLPTAIIAIPHRRYDSVKVEKEMTGRILQIEIPTWSEEELRFIPETGFKLLQSSIDEKVKAQLAHEAIGSPHLMQEFCRTICKIFDSEGRTLPPALEIAQGRLESAFREVADTIGRPIFEKLARGPRQRSDRVQRHLKDGRTVDIYELVLHALAHIRPGLVSLEYEDLRSAIKDISASQIPQLHEVARVLKHMATIAASDQSSTPVIDFEEEEKRLHITDPFFAFYLRWGELATQGSN
jgi:hypothetical protein